jgi:ribosome-associated protein
MAGHCAHRPAEYAVTVERDREGLAARRSVKAAAWNVGRARGSARPTARWPVPAPVARPARPAPDPCSVAPPVSVRGAVIPPAELSWRFSRSPGPGGQSVNTADSRVELSFDLAATSVLPPALKERAMRALAGRLVGGVLTVTASEHRSQLRNRQAAANRLATILTDATAPPPAQRRATRPGRAAQERRLAAKRRRSEVKRLRRPGGE